MNKVGIFLVPAQQLQAVDPLVNSMMIMITNYLKIGSIPDPFFVGGAYL